MAASVPASMHLGVGPDERIGVFIVGLDEDADVGAEPDDGSEGGAKQGFCFQDRE